MESFKRMGSLKQKARLSRKFSSRKSLSSLKTRFKKFISDHNAKGREAEGSPTTWSDSDRDDRETSSPPPDRSGELKRLSGSSSSSISDEGSPFKLKEHEKSDSSSDSSSEKKRKKGPQKLSSRKKLQVHLQQEPREVFRLPPVEETPPTSPQSNPPRFSTGALSDYGKLWAHASAPNSPANLAHNLHLSYRGGDSSPVALIHSLSGRERGKHASQLAEISLASPPGSGSLDLDVLDVKSEEIQASPSKTTPPLKPNGLPIVHHDEEQGVWRCGSCGWIYPNPNPSLRNRREHKKHCGEFTNVQRWLGAQDILGTSEKGAVDFAGTSDQWEGSDQHPKSSSADERPMAKSDREDNHEGESEMSTDPGKTMAEGRVDEVESSGSPDHHAVGVDGTNGRDFDTSVNPDEVDDHLKVNRVLEWPAVDSEIKDHNSARESLSNGSSRRHEVDDQSTLEDAPSWSTGHHGVEEINKLDDSVHEGLEISNPSRGASKMITPEVENEKEEPAAADAKLEQAIHDDESPTVLGSELEADESEANPKQSEETEDGGGDVKVQPVNGNERLEESRQHNFVAAHSNGHDLGHVEHTADLREEEDDSGNHDSSDNSDRPHDTGLIDVPELCNDRGIEGGQSIDDSDYLGNQDDSNNQTQSDDGLKEEEAEPAKEFEKMEPRVTADNGKPVDEAQEMQESQSIEPSLFIADLPNGKEQVDSKIGEIVEHDSVETGHEESNFKALKADAREVTKMDSGVSELTQPSHSQNGRLGTPNDHLGMEKDVKSNGGEFPDHRSHHQVTEIESVEGEGDSTRESSAQRNGIQAEIAEKSTGSSGSLEEPPKWMNSGMVTSQDEADRFSSVQKYWADVTSSKYLLVEGKRSPSFGGRSGDFGSLSTRNGDGRRSPSPFSLNKSEPGEIQSESSSDSIHHHIAVVDKDEDRINIPAEIVQRHASSSSGVHVEYDLVVHEQRTHDLFCPNCGHDVTKRIILKKRKRRLDPEDDGRLPKVPVTPPAGLQPDKGPGNDDTEDETWGCLACLSFFIRRGSRERESSDGEPSGTEPKRVPCLPNLFLWASGTSESDLQQPLLGQTNGEISEPRPGRFNEAPSDEEVSCFSYLQRPKSQPPAVDGSVPEAEPAKDEDTSGSPPVDSPEGKGRWNCLPELPTLSWGPRPVSTHPSLDTDDSPGMEGDEASSIPGPSNNPLTGSKEQEKCECLPFFSFASERFFSVTTVTEVPASAQGGTELDAGSPSSTPNEEGISDSLPASVPAFPVGSSSKYDLSPSPGISSPHRPIAHETDGQEESAARSPTAALTKGPVGGGDDDEKTSCNCLPELSPTFSWGRIPVYTHAPLDIDESSGRPKGAGADRPTSSLTQVPPGGEDLDGKPSSNCLAELFPAFSWGTVSADGPSPPIAQDNNTRRPLQPSTTDSKGKGQLDEGVSSPSTSEANDSVRPDVPADDASSHVDTVHKETATCMCIPLLLPAIQWGFTKISTSENGLREPLLPAAEPADLDDTSLVDSQQTAGVPGARPRPTHGEGLQGPPSEPIRKPVRPHGPEEGLQAPPSGAGLQEPLLPAAEPADLDDSSLVDSQQTAGVPGARPRPTHGEGLQSPPLEPIRKPVLPDGPEEGSQAPPSGAGTTGSRNPPKQSMLELYTCNCVPVTLPTVRWWGPSRGIGGGLEEHLLDKPGAAEENHDNGQTTAVGPGDGIGYGEGGACNCLPSVSLYHIFRDHHISSGEVAVDIDQTTETTFTVEGATSQEEAAAAQAKAQKKVAGKSLTTSEEYLKSIVHGGLDVTLVSLGIVASGAGGDAKTLTVIAIGLANLMFGLVTHVSNVMSLYYNNRTKFQDEVGKGFVHGCLSFLSFLLFGALAPIMYGFSFPHTTSTFYKMAATCVVALVSIVLLGAANAHVKSKSTVRVISSLVVTGFLAVVVGYEAGDKVVRLLEYFGFSSV